MEYVVYVYFVQIGESYVKIGSSYDPVERVATIRTSLIPQLLGAGRDSVKLLAMIPASTLSEDDAHQQFDRLRFFPDRGKIPCHRVGGYCEIFRFGSEIQGWMREHEAELIPEELWPWRQVYRSQDRYDRWLKWRDRIVQAREDKRKRQPAE